MSLATKVAISANYEVVYLAISQILGYVEREWRRATEVTAYEVAIYIDLSLIIYSAEVEHNLLLAPSGRSLNCAVVPDTCDDILVLNARKFTLWAEWNDNLVAEACAVEQLAVETCVYEVQLVGPLSIEVYPLATLKLRTRVLCTWLCCKSGYEGNQHNC